MAGNDKKLFKTLMQDGGDSHPEDLQVLSPPQSTVSASPNKLVQVHFDFSGMGYQTCIRRSLLIIHESKSEYQGYLLSHSHTMTPFVAPGKQAF